MSYYSGSYDSFPLFSWWGKGGAALSLIIFVVLTLLCSGGAMPDNSPLSGHGLCFPSPDCWIKSSLVSLWVNISLIVIAGISSIFFSRHYNFFPSGNMFYAVSLFLMCGATPLIGIGLNSGVVFLLVSVICLYRIFWLYGRKNKAQGVFLIFSLLSIGSMIQYGFILLMPVVLLGIVFMDSMRIREVIAMLLGIIAPYWILIAIGVVHVHDLQYPALTNLFYGGEPPLELFQLVLTVGITSLLFLFALTVNSMHATSDGVMQRARRSTVHLLGFSLLWFMVFDFTNMLTYLPAFYLCTGFEYTLWGMRLRGPQRLYLAISVFVIYISLPLVFLCV